MCFLNIPKRNWKKRNIYKIVLLTKILVSSSLLFDVSTHQRGPFLNKKAFCEGIKGIYFFFCEPNSETLWNQVKMNIAIIFILISVIYGSSALNEYDLYNINAPGSVEFQRGNDESKLINLQQPIHFYTEKYDSIYVSHKILKVLIHKFPFVNHPRRCSYINVCRQYF